MHNLRKGGLLLNIEMRVWNLPRTVSKLKNNGYHMNIKTKGKALFVTTGQKAQINGFLKRHDWRGQYGSFCGISVAY